LFIFFCMVCVVMFYFCLLHISVLYVV
jgi:hypothetical protein